MKHDDRASTVQSVQLIPEQHKSVTQAARGLGISGNTRHRWPNDDKQDPDIAFVNSGNLKPEDKALRDMQRRIKDLEQENESLKKDDAHLHEGTELAFGFIKEHRFRYPVNKMCELFGVSRSGYYAWLRRPKRERSKQ